MMFLAGEWSAVRTWGYWGLLLYITITVLNQVAKGIGATLVGIGQIVVVPIEAILRFLQRHHISFSPSQPPLLQQNNDTYPPFPL